jgi:hypothetical protein
MLNKLLEIIKEKYELKEVSTVDYQNLKASGMKFEIKAYDALGLGRVSIMKAKGFFGLMKMDTLMITPTDKDLPLLSYDRINAMGNDTLIIELYDTLINPCDLTPLQNVKNQYEGLLDHDLGQHWYDSIKFSESVSKKGKKKEYDKYNQLTIEYIIEYLNLVYKDIDNKDIKNEKSKVYVEGLLTNGGPSTTVFQKSLGKEKTEKLFKDILFGIK